MKLLYLILPLLFSFNVNAAPIPVVAAENFYGKLAEQIGGKYVTVTSILNDPNQDPHLFSNTPQFAIAFSQAKLIIYNGLEYDDWIDPILDKHKEIIMVSSLIPGQTNPHVWYNPQTMPLLADEISKKLAKLDPQHASYFEQQASHFKTQYQQLTTLISQLKEKHQGTPVIATEPLFNDMADALGLIMHGKDFQLAIMNDSTPSPQAIKAFEEKLASHAVNLLIFNTQVSDNASDHMIKLAEKSSIPTIGVSETQPTGTTYIEWMTSQLNALSAALK